MAMCTICSHAQRAEIDALIRRKRELDADCRCTYCDTPFADVSVRSAHMQYCPARNGQLPLTWRGLAEYFGGSRSCYVHHAGHVDGQPQQERRRQRRDKPPAGVGTPAYLMCEIKAGDVEAYRLRMSEITAALVAWWASREDDGGRLYVEVDDQVTTEDDSRITRSIS